MGPATESCEFGPILREHAHQPKKGRWCGWELNDEGGALPRHRLPLAQHQHQVQAHGWHIAVGIEFQSRGAVLCHHSNKRQASEHAAPQARGALTLKWQKAVFYDLHGTKIILHALKSKNGKGSWKDALNQSWSRRFGYEYKDSETKCTQKNPGFRSFK